MQISLYDKREAMGGGNIPQCNKCIHGKLIGPIVLNREKVEIRNSLFLSTTVLEVLVTSIKQEKEVKGM